MQFNLEGIIPLIAGVYGLLLAYKVISIGQETEKAERWHQQWSRKVKILSPIVILFGVALLLRLL